MRKKGKWWLRKHTSCLTGGDDGDGEGDDDGDGDGEFPLVAEKAVR